MFRTLIQFGLFPIDVFLKILSKDSFSKFLIDEAIVLVSFHLFMIAIELYWNLSERLLQILYQENPNILIMHGGLRVAVLYLEVV
jgi:hypothetical protein